MGTTDTFGVDRVKPVRDLCDKTLRVLRDHSQTAHSRGLGCRLATGIFSGIRFCEKPLDINEPTLEGLYQNVERFRELHHADSFTIDFQKWGMCPNTSSLVMVREKNDLKALEHDPENFSYLIETPRDKPLHSTIECSRGGPACRCRQQPSPTSGEGYQLLCANSCKTRNISAIN